MWRTLLHRQHCCYTCHTTFDYIFTDAWTLYFGHFSVHHFVQIYLSSWEPEPLFIPFFCSPFNHPFPFSKWNYIRYGIWISWSWIVHICQKKKRVKRRENHLIWYITHHNIMSIRHRCTFNVWIKKRNTSSLFISTTIKKCTNKMLENLVKNHH